MNQKALPEKAKRFVEPFHNIFKYCGIRDLHFVIFHNISWSDVFFVESDLCIPLSRTL